MTAKNRLVYSTNPDFVPYDNTEDKVETLLPSSQTLYISRDKKQRKGKQVTLVEGFAGTSADLAALGKMLKSKCGAGGSVKEGVILVQGDFREKIKEILERLGYKCKLKGG
ncbi:MAG: translation initiation factor [Bacteroidales bacterium]|nr:translation initiation factor [Bacteroidales bacterium]MCF6341936.1 translation initiation factor [Bacteroidales bacterium]